MGDTARSAARAQSAKTQTKPSEADTLPSQKQEDTKSKKGEIDPFTVGQYTCFARLGEGGMGMVYKARHTNLDREAAVKVLSPSAMIAPMPSSCSSAKPSWHPR